MSDRIKIHSLDKRGRDVNTIKEYQEEVLKIYYHAQMHAAILGLMTFSTLTSDEISDMVTGILWEIDRVKELEAEKVDE